METANPSAAMDALMYRLTQEQNAFFLEPFSFLWWLRGGEPGSPSDHLTLECDRGSVKATYIRTGFDPARHPPTYAETFSGAIHRDGAAAILKQLFASPLFRMVLAEESEGQLRDGQKETWSFKNHRQQYSKTVFEPLPPALETLRALCRKTAEEVAQVHRR